MKTKNPTVFVLLSVLVLFYGCADPEGQSKDASQQEQIKTGFFQPVTKHIDLEALSVSVPGKDGLKEPESVIAKMPKPIDFAGIEKIEPGVSYLHQTVNEKLAGVKAVKSEKAEIIKMDPDKLKKSVSSNEFPPGITHLGKDLFLSAENVSDYKKIAIERGLFSIQHNDTILPPMSFLMPKARQIQALPSRFKDETIFNISILDSDQGLSNTFIRAIAKDQRGVMWFATSKGGFISYDGDFLMEYKSSLGKSRELVFSLIVDRKNRIWTGSTNGANCFDGKKNTRYSTKQGLPSNNIVALLEDSKGNIWFATDEGVSVFNGDKITTYKKANGLALNYVYTLFEDSDANIWFGTFGGGVSRFDGETFVTFTKENGLASNSVVSIIEDSDGNMWFGTIGGGVSKFDGQYFTNYSSRQGLVSNDILAMLQDKEGNMWFGSYGHGLSLFDGNSFTNYAMRDGLSDNYIRALIEDENGNVWLGTDLGITRFNKNSFRLFTTKHGLKDNLVTSIFQDKQGRMWFAPYDNGLMVFDNPEFQGKTSSFIQITTKQGLANNIVHSVVQDKQNNYWIGTYGGGISKLDGKSFEQGVLKFTNYSLEQGLPSRGVKELCLDDQGKLWIATDKGIATFDGKGFVDITGNNAEKEAEKALCVCQARDGAIWFGTMGNGVARLRHDSITYFTEDQGLGNNTVWTIKEDTNGILWFGTDGGGLTYYNGNSFATLDQNDGVCNPNVFSITRDNNNSLWLGSLKGLCRIKLPKLKTLKDGSVAYVDPTIVNYGKPDGLKGLDFYTRAGFLDNKNRLWWGTEKALTMLDLKTFEVSQDTPRVILNNITINSQYIDFNELEQSGDKEFDDIHFNGVTAFDNIPLELSLPFEKRHLTFNFSAIDWSNPGRARFKYKLKGLDDEWSLLSTDNTADYRNVPPGHYTFLVRAQGKSGLWSHSLEYPFIVRWPWWLSWWMIVHYVFALLFAVWLIVRWRVNIIKRQKAILESMVARRTKAIDDALLTAEKATNAKSQFIATMSHEIRTPLNAILGLTNLAIDNAIDQKQRDYLQKIDRSANTMLSLINDILDFSKIEVGKMQLEKVPFDIEIVMNSVIILNSQLARDKDLEFIVNIDSKIPRMLIGDPLRLGQVITNFCSNAIKFTSNGEIAINIGLKDEAGEDEIDVQFSVRDTGIGIEKDQIPGLFAEFEQADNSITRKYGGTGLGLSISKLLVEVMGGHVWVESTPNVGTTFFFNCKLGVQKNETTLLRLTPDELKKINILVCDDNITALRTMKSILRTLLLNVDTVGTGEEVLMQVKDKHYDLLIIDQHLKGLSGTETIARLGKANGLSIKSILMTNCELEHRGKGADGVSGYLLKPVLPSVVFDELLSVFGYEKKASKSNGVKTMKIKQLTGLVSDRNILLVEDNELNRQVIIELMDRVNVNLDIAENGKEALALVSKNKYDLIFMDLHMPVMDGYTATKEIRKSNTGLPIVAMTADAIGVANLKSQESGFNDIITKPINPDLVYGLLSKWVAASGEPIAVGTEKHEKQGGLISEMNIKGLDINLAIKRFGNNEGLYTKMLKKFITANQSTLSRVLELMKEGDFENAHLIIHSFKGECANIGATKVHTIIKVLEKTVLNKDVEGFKGELKVFESAFYELTSDLNGFFEENENETKNDIVDLKTLINDLKESLVKKDPKAFDLLDKLGEFGVKQKEIARINDMANSGKTSEAIALLEKLSGDLNKTK